ncbi:hypothetical protein MASR1M12_30850 [Erysipelotrichia bacterium]
MLHGGGRYLEDIREIARDEALLKLLGINAVWAAALLVIGLPTGDAKWPCRAFTL